MKRKTAATVISQQEITEKIFDLWLETDLAAEARPGQFVGVYPKDKSTLLPRPISICEVNGERTALRLVYRIAGKGTGEFSEYGPGEKVALLGVLGNGFPLEAAQGKKAYLLGGGIGIPPLLQLAKELTGDRQLVLGYRDSRLFLKEDMEQYAKVAVATEDGSVGVKGNVLDAMAELLPSVQGAAQPCEGADRLETADAILYACGPMPMLRGIKAFAQEHKIKAYISLEEHMACGVGACLGCVVKTKEMDHHSHVHNARICTEGPVFDAEEVDL